MNVVFDLGAVLFAWEPARLVQAHLAPHAPTEAAAAALGRALFHHDDWTGFDCGTRTLDDAIARMSARLALPPASLHAMLDGLGERLEPIGVTLGPLRLQPRYAVAPGTVKVAVRPEAWEIGALDGLPATLRKAAYLGSFYEYGFDTPLGPVFVVSTDLSRPLAAGTQTRLSLGTHGVSVVPGA